MTTKYIFIDIDGTLLSYTKGVPKSALEAIDIARKNGHKVFINTGRVKSAVDELLKFFPFDGYVFAAGGYVQISDDVIYENILSKEDILKSIELFEKHAIGYVLEGSEYSYYNKQALENFRKRLENHKNNMEPQVRRHMIQENMVYPMSDYFENPQDINKISLFADSLDDILRLEKEFDNKFEFINYEKSAEIITRGIDKAHGVRVVLEHFGGDMQDAIAIGDSMNDYPMVRDAGIGIAMGNAHPNLKKVADYITFDPADGGIYHAFKKFNLI